MGTFKMIIRRTPGKQIKIIHNPTQDIFNLKLVNVNHNCSTGFQIQIEMVYQKDQYWTLTKRFSIFPEHPRFIYFQRGSEILLRHISGHEMFIQIIRVNGKDADFRLNDPARKFEFLWSEKRLENSLVMDDNFS